MIPKLKITFVLILCILSLLCFSLIASHILGQQIAQFDHNVITFIQGMESPGLTLLMKVFTFIGSTPIVIVIALSAILFLYFVLHHRFELVFFVSIVAGTGIINLLLKLYFARQRPDLHRLIQETGYSFPSGHSMEAFALYASLAFLLWRHICTRIGRTINILICIVMIGLIGISRIYLGVHYPSDVIGGYLASGVYFTLGVWLFQWYKEYRAYNKKVKQKTS
ncbi:phosphatase PAP2 family protein [Paenibacillus alginolyticus]|uniref:Phosphatase PAP2 family protein n=1 Tax=Paenibacillus alginolyticus TaxID=59839 RepID=A0ABT4GQD4_9BACL|nr:phosphatase PAP2 family protein [Paenibacillus alginolyticus]MCY9698335.1 phosphatase PAP2 family protein [Paenibacillus alginolyticus]MEC0145697.1 phosphatase PAP2 family protein [Paenibacillus alginolyticus]